MSTDGKLSDNLASKWCQILKLEIYNFLNTKSIPDFRIYQQMRYVTM